MPLGGGVGDEGFARILDEVVEPLAWRFQPQLILVSAGYDAHWDDPLATMQLSVGGYAAIARALKDLADDLCDGRLVFTLEGGYHLEALAYSILNTFAVLLGRRRTGNWSIPWARHPAPSGRWTRSSPGCGRCTGWIVRHNAPRRCVAPSAVLGYNGRHLKRRGAREHQTRSLDPAHGRRAGHDRAF